MSQKLRLKIELVPGSSWYDNLRKFLSQSDWRKIREEVCSGYEWRCGICGAKGRLFCHEVWEYDDRRHIQKLVGLISLCGMCHLIKHWGFAGILAAEGKLKISKEGLIRHFMKVNHCDKKTFEEHLKEAFEEHSKRSQYKWRVDFGRYKNILKSSSLKKSSTRTRR